MDLKDQITIFKSLFKGREDVFAIRWEKGSKSGYMPAYQYDPYVYRLHRIKGGTFKDFRDKSFLPLSDNQIEDHLAGKQFIGIYPLLLDNSSWFIAADFDGDKWISECRALLAACLEKGISAYLERSRSGKGGHVWIFFDKPYPAYKSRMILRYLLEASGVISEFDKSSSYDRLFPNQDYHSGKRLGNLIAAPLNGVAITESNTCFIDKDSLNPYPDQWVFLKKIERVSNTNLDTLFTSFNESIQAVDHKPAKKSGVLRIELDNEIHLSREGLDKKLHC